MARGISGSGVPYLAGVVSCIGHCRDCDFEVQAHKNGQALAAQHAKRTGHTISVEVANVITYNPTD